MTHAPSESSQDTRRRLLEAALIIFADKGFDGAGIREIAEHAKANSAMVQYHFGGKEGLYREALRYAFEQGPKWLQTLPPLPDLEQADAWPRVLRCFRDYIHNFLQEFMACNCIGKYLPEEVDRAAHILWNREMQFPRPSMEAFLLESIRPFTTYLNGCLQILRPELGEEELFRMGMSIHAQLIWMHNHAEFVRMMRGKAYGIEDLDSLAAHFTTFSLRGLGIPEALTPQGA